MWVLDVLRALRKAKIQYAVAGGYAVALHGVVRGTVDLDLVIALQADQLDLVEKTLHRLGLRSRLPITAQDVAKFRREYIEKRNLFAWNFIDPAHSLRQVDLLLTHDVRKLKTITIKIQDLPVSVIAKSDLIAMKRASGRPQDLEDAKALAEESK